MTLEANAFTYVYAKSFMNLDFPVAFSPTTKTGFFATIEHSTWYALLSQSVVGIVRLVMLCAAKFNYE